MALLKFMLRCAASGKKLHILSGLDIGTVEKNIINKEFGILDDFGPLAEYYPAGYGKTTQAHIRLKTSDGERIIYVLGYGNRERWKKALGGQYGCVYIDEVNIADMEYLREAAMRADYLLATLNPDDPRKPVYDEYINHARPLPEWEGSTPEQIRKQLCQPPKTGWVHWFFGFEDNAALSEETRRRSLKTPPRAAGSTATRSWACGAGERASFLKWGLPTASARRNCGVSWRRGASALPGFPAGWTPVTVSAPRIPLPLCLTDFWRTGAR